MHELSVCEDIIELIEEKAKVERFKKVLNVTLEIGRLSHVDEQAIRFCFDAVIQNTLVEGAKLSVVFVDGKGHCQHCDQDSAMDQLYDPCPYCGQFGREIVTGQQVNLKQLEVC